MNEVFGTTPDGERVERYTLSNGRGLTAKVLTYGATLQEVWAPGRDGPAANVVLGFPNLDGYVAPGGGRPYFGAVIGRYANRIAGGRFELDGTTYQLDVNEPPNTLHGGNDGFDRQVWAATTLPADAERVGLVLRYVSPAGAGGFPGAVSVEVAYTLTNANVLRLDYRATTDAPTVLNLTNHTYWNLSGEGAGSIHDHVLWAAASRYAPVDATGIPTGDLAPVAGTPFDFTHPTTIGARIRTNHEQLRRVRGYDHYLVLDREPGSSELLPAATLTDPASGRRLEIATTAAGFQCYSGNFLDGTLAGTGGRLYRSGDGLALETHAFPDAPNQPSFPSTVLRPGEVFTAATSFTLGGG